jgi:hypothetical protein
MAEDDLLMQENPLDKLNTNDEITLEERRAISGVIETLREEKATVVELLEGAVMYGRTLTQGVEQLEEEVLQLTSSVRERDQDNEALRSEVNSLRVLLKDTETLEEELSYSRGELEGKDKVIASLKKQIQEQKSQAKSDRAGSKDTISEVRDFESVNAGLEDRVEELLREKAETSEKLSKLQDALTDALKLAPELQAKTSEVELLRKALRDKERIAEETQAKVAEAMTKTKEDAETISNLNLAIVNLKQENFDQKAIIDADQERTNIWQPRYGVSDSLGDLQDDQLNQVNSLSELSPRPSETQFREGDKDEKILELQSQLAIQKQDLESTFALERGSLQGQIDQLEAESSALKQQELLSKEGLEKAERELKEKIAKIGQQAESVIGEQKIQFEKPIRSDESEVLSFFDGITKRDRQDLEDVEESLEGVQDELFLCDDLSIPGLQGNLKDRKKIKTSFPDKASEIEQLGNLPIEFYDKEGLASFQKQINDASGFLWENGSCQLGGRKGHKALISYAFDGTNYLAIVAQEGRVSVNFVSYEYMKQQSDELMQKSEEVPQIGNVDKLALSNFYQNKLEEISRATNVVVANTNDNLDKIYQSFVKTAENKSDSLESLIFSPALAPINLDGLGGYSISRENTKDGKTNIRINCISDEGGKFRDNVMYANVTGTDYYVKVQVARNNGETIDGVMRQEGDIVILKGLYKEPKVGGEMSQDQIDQLPTTDKNAIANCNIVANAVIRGKQLGDKVKISSAVKFEDKIINQEVKEEEKSAVLKKQEKKEKGSVAKAIQLGR